MTRPADAVSATTSPARAAPPSRRRRSFSSVAQAVWRRREWDDLRAYLDAHPEVAGDPDLVCDLAYEDYCRRVAAGEDVDRGAFCARFPECASALEEATGAHKAVDRWAELLEACPVTVWPEAGDTFQGFLLRRELGRGAFGRVFLAREPALGDREVVVKISAEGAVEADTLGRLVHPNIVPVHSVRQDAASGLTAICMPYLGSTTLEDVLVRVAARGRLPDRAAFLLDAAGGPGDGSTPAGILRRGSYAEGVLHLGAQLAGALDCIHSRQIYHQDLKPSNVLLAPGGRPMLLDFNLSRGAAFGQLGGTLPYMAPEQLRATASYPAAGPDEVGGPADVFALGVLLYELLTGKHPFVPLVAAEELADQRACLLERQARGPRPLREENPLVAPVLARAVERCLAFDPGRRWAAAELATTLRRELTPLRRAGRRLAAALPAALRTGAVLAAATAAGTAGVATRGHDGRPNVERGQAALATGDLRHAIADFSRALDEDPELYPARVGRARAYQQLGQFEQARDDWARADAQRADGRTRACLAYCLSKLGKHELALTYYRRALDAEFATAPVLNDFGHSLYQQHRLDEAESCLHEAIRLDPNLWQARWNFALCDFERARQDLAKGHLPLRGIEALEQAGALFPSGAPASLHHHAARLYALAAERVPPGQREPWVERAMQAAELAVAQGCDPAALKEDYFLRSLKGRQRFERAVASPPPPNPARPPSLLADPLGEFAD